jgi:hypothetical protein
LRECDTIQRPNKDIGIKDLGFIENGTGIHQSNKVISTGGLMTTEYAGMYKNPQKFIDIKEVDNER